MIKGGKRKALIVGISDYVSLQKLDFCKKDGLEVYEILSTLGYEISENNKLIGEVKGEKIKDIIYDFFDDINNSPDDTLLFYYSGHGVPDSDGDTYLASSDIDADRPYRRGFSFDQLTKMIQKCVSTRVVAILDCCYSGAAKVSKGREDDAATLGRISIDDKSRKLPQGQGKYILAASQAAQEAYALTTSDHSIFTYYLLQGLKGNAESVDGEGNVTPQSLGTYVYRAIMSLPANKRPKQTPITRAEESGNVILAYHPELKPIKNEDTLASMLKLLHEGKVEEFNRMREQNPTVSLNFSSEDLYGVQIAGANLSSANLSRINFTHADLEGANLSGANLFRADLEGANLYKANLNKAVLEAANFSNANLTKANLSNANLSRANLSYANSYSADLQQANLIGADLRGTNLTAANLKGADLRGSIFEEQKKPKGTGTTTATSDMKTIIDSISSDSTIPITDVSTPQIRRSRRSSPSPKPANAPSIINTTDEYSFITEWGYIGSGDGQFNMPAGVAVDSSGNVYVTDFGNDRIQKFNSNGAFITKWGSPGKADGQFNCPVGVAVDSSGNVYMADRGNHRIQVFAPS
jgi:Caspase domain/Pentapeptide repeats (8 copies)/NHL repeat